MKSKTTPWTSKPWKIGEVVVRRETYNHDQPEYFVYRGGKRVIKLRSLTVAEDRSLVVGKQVEMPLSARSDYARILGLIVGPDSQLILPSRI